MLALPSTFPFGSVIHHCPMRTNPHRATQIATRNIIARVWCWVDGGVGWFPISILLHTNLRLQHPNVRQRRLFPQTLLTTERLPFIPLTTTATGCPHASFADASADLHSHLKRKQRSENPSCYLHILLNTRYLFKRRVDTNIPTSN